MSKRIIFLTLILFLSIGLYAGGTGESVPETRPVQVHEISTPGAGAGYPLEVTDSAGKLIRLEAPVKRVVSLTPNVTETIFALGKGELLVGRSNWCDYPPEVESVTPVGDLQGPSTETIISLTPDLVLASTHAPMEELALLSQAGISSAVFYGPQKYAGAYDVIRGTASLLEAVEEGQTIIADMKARAEAVKTAVSGMENHPSVYYVVGFGEGGDWTAGAGTFMDEMITMAGGINAAGDTEGWSYSLEKLLEQDPDIVIIAAGLKELFRQAEFYNELTAVKEGQVYGIDENVIVRPGPRLAEGLETLHGIFNAEGDRN